MNHPAKYILALTIKRKSLTMVCSECFKTIVTGKSNIERTYILIIE